MMDFDRFWMPGNSPYDDESEDEAPGATGDEVPPGVTADEILEWEREYGVTLPEPLRTALGLRNGGYVRNSQAVEVLPLAEIVPVVDDFWEYTEIEEDEAPDRGLVFLFGSTNTGGTLLMNFNAQGPEGEPSVYIDYHGESTDLINDTIGGFFDAMLDASDEPGVDWSEAEAEAEAKAGVPVIARETVDLSALHDGRPASKDQVLAREGEALVLFTRERSPAGEVRTRTTLPLPLDDGWAEIRPYRPAPAATFALHLQPAESAGIVQERSETDDDGRWKDSTQHGVPIYVTIESADRDRLDVLRTQLFGTEAAARARAKQDRQAALQEMLDTLPPEQRTAALLQAALTMKEELDRQFAAHLGDLGPVPPELAGVAEAMRLKLEEMAEQVRRSSAANPPDPEMLRRIEESLRDPEAG